MKSTGADVEIYTLVIDYVGTALPIQKDGGVTMAKWEDGFCSNCKEYAIVEWNECGGEIVLSKYCPHCGSKMEDEA